MSTERIVSGTATLEEIRDALRQAPLVAVRQELPDQSILDACDRCNHVWRERLYDPIVTVLHFIAQALQRDISFAGTWQEFLTPVAAKFLGAFDFNFDRSALTHARGRLPVGVLETLARDACKRASQLPSRPWKRLRLVALDSSTVSMPRDGQLCNHFGLHKVGSTISRYPLATFASLLDISYSLLLDYRIGPYDPGEISTATPLLASLKKGDILLADRLFSNAPFIIRVAGTGADFLMRKNALLRVDRLPVIERLGRDDFITELPLNEKTRRKYPELPAMVRVRFFKSYWKAPDGGKVYEWFVTSLLDSRRFKKTTLAGLFHCRWQMETSYLEFKQTFHAAVMRSKTVDNVYKELTAHVLAYQLVRLLMAHAAQRSGKKPTEISTLNASRWIMAFSRAMAPMPACKLPSMYLTLLDAIASNEIDVRPGRSAPRALCRDWKRYPRLRISRQEWRTIQLARVS